MLTVFLKFLLCIWTRLAMRLGVPTIAVIDRVERRIHSLYLQSTIPEVGVTEGRFGFERHMNSRLFTGNFHFSLHPGLCVNSPIEWRQVDFRRTMILPLFGDQWPVKRTYVEAGTV